MTRIVPFLVTSLAFLTAPASAQPGGGTDLYRVNLEVQEMMRDGRWQQLLDQAQAGRQAAGPVQPAEARPVVPRRARSTATRSRRR